MKLSKKVQRILMASTVLLAVGSGSARAADTPFGSCIGDNTPTDCTAATGHASISVTDTLSVNEMRGLSFGNFAAGAPGVGDTVVLNLDGSRDITGTIVGLHGADANDGAGGDPGDVNSGGQSPGHYTITGLAEGTTAQVYISFADASGNLIDMCEAAETDCDSYYPGNSVSLGSGLTLDHFFINESGSDVYGHYIVNAGNASTAGGSSTPWGPGSDPTAGHDNGASGIDVVVGGRLTSDGTALAAGKYEGTFNIMASY